MIVPEKAEQLKVVCTVTIAQIKTRRDVDLNLRYIIRSVRIFLYIYINCFFLTKSSTCLFPIIYIVLVEIVEKCCQPTSAEAGLLFALEDNPSAKSRRSSSLSQMYIQALPSAKSPIRQGQAFQGGPQHLDPGL